jgi:hypothetical protein
MSIEAATVSNMWEIAAIVEVLGTEGAAAEGEVTGTVRPDSQKLEWKRLLAKGR